MEAKKSEVKNLTNEDDDDDDDDDDEDMVVRVNSFSQLLILWFCSFK